MKKGENEDGEMYWELQDEEGVVDTSGAHTGKMYRHIPHLLGYVNIPIPWTRMRPGKMGNVGRTFPNSSCLVCQFLSHFTHLEQPSLPPPLPLSQEGSRGKTCWKREIRNKKARAGWRRRGRAY